MATFPNARVNYSAAEKALFLDLLKERKDVIESKKTDGVNQVVKERAWKALTDEFNASSVIQRQRTLPQLKKWWANLKQLQRDIKTSQRRNAFATGGGPPNSVKDIDPDIEAIAPDLMQPAPCFVSANNSAENSEKAKEIIFAGNLEDLNNFLKDNSGIADSILSDGIGKAVAETALEAAPEESLMDPHTDTETQGAKRTQDKSEEIDGTRSKKSKLENPRMELALQHMNELHQLKLTQMKLEFERKEAHARHIEEIEVQVYKTKFENERELLRHLLNK